MIPIRGAIKTNMIPIKNMSMQCIMIPIESEHKKFKKCQYQLKVNKALKTNLNQHFYTKMKNILVKLDTN